MSSFFCLFVCFFTLFYFTIIYWFCHTLTWIRHGCTWVPNPEPPSWMSSLVPSFCSVPFSFSYPPNTPTPPSCSPTEVIHVSRCVHPFGPLCFMILTRSNENKYLLSVCAQCIHPLTTSAPAWLLSYAVRKLLASMILNLLFLLKMGDILSPFFRRENWGTERLSKWPVCLDQWGRALVYNHVSWEEENGYVYVYGWFPLLSTWNCLHIVEWLYSNIK